MTLKFKPGDRVYCKEFGCGAEVIGSELGFDQEEEEVQIRLNVPTSYGSPPKPMWTLWVFASDLVPVLGSLDDCPCTGGPEECLSRGHL